jgi:hypothetical protein
MVDQIQLRLSQMKMNLYFKQLETQWSRCRFRRKKPRQKVQLMKRRLIVLLRNHQIYLINKKNKWNELFLTFFYN